MKILVFDDNPIHRAAAQAQLKDHDLTVAATYDDAQNLLLPRFDYKKYNTILKGQFGDFDPYDPINKEKRAEYDAAEKIADESATTYPNFDVVLSDLLVPASRQEQGPDGEALVGTEMPVGIFIGLLAAVKGHARYVAVFTDSSHHSHPASASIDAFNHDENEPTAFTVEGAKVLLSNTRNWVERFDPKDLSTPLEYEQYEERTDTVRAKNWGKLLAYLTAE